MHKVPLNKESIYTRLSYIEDSVNSLERFKGISFEKFHADSDNFRIAFYDLHRALEAIMEILSLPFVEVGRTLLPIMLSCNLLPVKIFLP